MRGSKINGSRKDKIKTNGMEELKFEEKTKSSTNF